MRKLGKARYGLAALASLAAGLAVAAEPLHGWKFDSGVTLRETWTDNVGVTATNAKSDFITEIAPYITARKRGADLKVDFRYNMQNLFYLSDSERNKIHHQLSATANAELYDKHLFLDVNASASQQVTNPLGATSTSTTSATGNVTDVYSLSVSPYWQHRFGTYANLLARYSRSQTTSSGNTYSNSGSDFFNVSLNSGSAFTQLFWGLNLSEQATDYSNRPDVKHSSQSITLGYPLTDHLRLNVTKGYEENNYLSATGPTRGGFWNTSVRWVPSQRTELEIGYGDHYYGGSWFGTFNRRGENLSWNLSYSESITTPSGSSFDYSSTRENVETVTSEYYRVGDYTTQGQVLTNSVYLDRSLRANINYKKGRNDFGISLNHSRRTGQEAVLNAGTLSFSGCTFYFAISGLECGTSTVPLSDQDSSFNQVKTVGMDLYWNRSLSQQTKGHLRLGMSRSTYSELNRQDDMRNIELGLSRTFARSMTGNLTVRHQERDSSQANADTSENAVSASVTIPF